MERIKVTDLRRRISWGSIFAGVFTVLAISVLLSILASSISLYMFDPTSDSPTSGIGTNMGIWAVVSLLISFAAGGFIAGKLAGADGMIHGFLVWATTLIVSVILAILLAIGTVRLASNILGSVFSAAGSVVSGVGSAVGSGVSSLADGAQDIFGNIDVNSDADDNDLRQDIRTALKKSGVKEFQPEYLQNQMSGVKSDFDKALKQLATNPNNADAVINNFLERLQTRGERYADNINRDDLTRAIANNSSMTQAQVDQAVEEYIIFFDRMKERGREQIDNLQQNIEQAKQDWEEMKQNARIEADKAASAAASSMLISFFALLIGAVICVFTGAFGTKKTLEGYEA